MNLIIFTGAALAFFALPFSFAIRELLRPSDGEALKVHQGNAADATDDVFEELQNISNVSDDALVAKGIVRLPDVDTELVDASAFEGKHIVSVGDISLAGAFDKVRSVHARSLHLKKDFRTEAKLSAADSVLLETGATLQVLQSPTIVTYSSAHSPQPVIRVQTSKKPALVDGAVHYPQQGWWRAKELATVLCGTTVEGDVISQGGIKVEAFSTINGSLKSAGAIHIRSGSVINGNILCKTLHLEEGVTVLGSILTEGSLTIQRFCNVGKKDKPASLTAEVIAISSDVVIHGGISAVLFCRIV